MCKRGFIPCDGKPTFVIGQPRVEGESFFTRYTYIFARKHPDSEKREVYKHPDNQNGSAARACVEDDFNPRAYWMEKETDGRSPHDESTSSLSSGKSLIRHKTICVN